MLERETKNLRLVKRVNTIAYLVLIFLSVTFLVSMTTHNFERKMEMGLIGIVLLIAAVLIAFPLYVIQIRFEIVKEMKELQLRIIELGEKISSKA